MKTDYKTVSESRNELEAILRIKGISKQKFGRILNIKGNTIERYLSYPYLIRYFHMMRLAKFLNLDVKDVIDIIEVDLQDDFVVQGEPEYKKMW
tara:strand:+ start:387 stop:668 length:282 start_codon:yes stop_codon:yes gene_type:complete